MSNAESSCSVPSSSPSPFSVPSNIPVPPSPLAAPKTTSFAPPTPVTHLRAPPRPFASPIPPIYGQPHIPLRHVHSGTSMVHECQSQQYQPNLAYLDSYMSASPYLLHGHRLFPTIEKLKDNRMTMRGEPTLTRTHEPMISRNQKTTGTTSPQKAAKWIMQSQIM